jgi:hypothetical protein
MIPPYEMIGRGQQPRLPGQLQARQACAGPQDGRTGLRVVAVSALGRPAGPIVSSRRTVPRYSLSEPPPLQPGRMRGHRPLDLPVPTGTLRGSGQADPPDSARSDRPSHIHSKQIIVKVNYSKRLSQSEWCKFREDRNPPACSCMSGDSWL